MSRLRNKESPTDCHSLLTSQHVKISSMSRYAKTPSTMKSFEKMLLTSIVAIGKNGSVLRTARESCGDNDDDNDRDDGKREIVQRRRRVPL